MMIVKPNIRNRTWKKDGLKFLPLCYFKYSLHQNIFLFLPTRSEFGSHPMCTHTSQRPSLLSHRADNIRTHKVCLASLAWAAHAFLDMCGPHSLVPRVTKDIVKHTHKKNHKALSVVLPRHFEKCNH